jgi:hypothetical protein
MILEWKAISNVVSIASCKNVNGTILIANNGTKEVGIILNSLNDQALELHVHNALGQLVEVKNVAVVKGYNNVKVDLEMFQTLLIISRFIILQRKTD